MTATNHLVAFVKTPRLGRVKSRLAADVGAVAATAFYRRTLASVLPPLARDARWRCWLAVTPDSDGCDAGCWPVGWRPIPQGRGDLGQRMARPLRRLPPGRVVIIGTDIPDIRPHHVARAFEALGASDVVFGPSSDGGYWLIGLDRRHRMLNPFKDVRWSTEYALADTLANFDDGINIALLETLDDIDDGADLARWRSGKS
jgi:rSAM/selenodomain-associated transferase 1